MLNTNLSEETKKALKKLQRKTKDARVHKKIAVILGLDIGLDYVTLAEILSLDENTVRRYEKEYNVTEKSDDFIKDDYTGYWGKLDSTKLGKLVNELNNTLYSCTNEIASWIKANLFVEFTNQGLVHLLHRLGFVYKKTRLIPAKVDKEKQLEFIRKFNELKENLKPDEVIYFSDAVHPVHNTTTANGWISKGEDKEIKSNTGRERININGVINPDNKEVIVKSYETINADTVIEFYKLIEANNLTTRVIYIILDNARYNWSKKVQEYLKTSKIVQVFLPSYSPNLNLIERLWKFMRKKAINNVYYEKYKDFYQKIIDFFDNISIYRKELDSLITCNFQLF